MVYICTKFHENTLDGIKVMELRFFFSAHRLMMVYISTKFNENILDDIKIIERTQFS